MSNEFYNSLIYTRGKQHALLVFKIKKKLISSFSQRLQEPP